MTIVIELNDLSQVLLRNGIWKCEQKMPGRRPIHNYFDRRSFLPDARVGPIDVEVFYYDYPASINLPQSLAWTFLHFIL